MNKALIVDDELDICLMITRYLQQLNFETQYTHTVKDAQRRLSNARFDLMFVDLNLSDGSGFDVLKHLSGLNRKTKVVVISAYDSEANKALRAGADFFLAKPFASKRINETLTTLNLLPK